MRYLHRPGLWVQGSAKMWALGCVNSIPAARESQEAGFTQPRAHFIVHLCAVVDSDHRVLSKFVPPILFPETWNSWKPLTSLLGVVENSSFTSQKVSYITLDGDLVMLLESLVRMIVRKSKGISCHHSSDSDPQPHHLNLPPMWNSWQAYLSTSVSFSFHKVGPCWKDGRRK